MSDGYQIVIVFIKTDSFTRGNSMQKTLFESIDSFERPLSFRMRPEKIEHFVGQETVIKRLEGINLEGIQHIVFHGPPGSGKTTLALILAAKLEMNFVPFNAVLAGVPELRKRISEIMELLKFQHKRSILFIDEIHRFNKAQQDALLPYLERGDFLFFGATTEYPQTSLNRAILSRVNVLELKALEEKDISQILTQALKKESQTLSVELIDYLSHFANGDARFALNKLEELLLSKQHSIENLKKILSQQSRHYDKNSDRHYDVISAFIKSVRGSDPDAAILWLAVMLDGGEDPEFIARRLMILSSEDIGNADPRALQMSTAAHYSLKNIGMPEARIILSQVTVYLARAPKSNSTYLAIDKALAFVRENPTISVPTHLRNHHKDKSQYLYPHSYPQHFVEQVYQNEGAKFFESSELGYEAMQTHYENKVKK